MENALFGDLIVLTNQLAAPPHPEGERLTDGDPALCIECKNTIGPFGFVTRLCFFSICVESLLLFAPVVLDRDGNGTQKEIVYFNHFVPLPEPTPRAPAL